MKYVNWLTISTTIVSLIIVGLLTMGWSKACAEYSAFQTIKQEVQSNKEQHLQMQQANEVLQQIAVDIAGIKKNILTVTGRAVVRDFGDAACMRINSTGRAAEYAKMQRARVTNMSSTEMPSVVVKIEGVFRSAGADYLATLSRHAASLIDASGTVNVRIEPVEGE